LVTLLLLAQSQGTATIRGRVVDQTGGALPGAIVTVTNTDTGISRETTTDRTGFYTVPSLPLTGEYVVRIAVPGFSTRQTDPLDGSSADDAWGRQTIFTNVPLSAVQEFTVLSNAFSAEYGRTTGGAVNIVTKSGTNVVRGDTLVLFRPARLEPSLTIDALAAINNLSSTMKVPDARHQIGGSRGRPLLQGRWHR